MLDGDPDGKDKKLVHKHIALNKQEEITVNHH